MQSRLKLSNVRPVRAKDGRWFFLPRTPSDSELDREVPSLLAMTPNGRVFDVYLPAGTDPKDLSDRQLLEMARSRAEVLRVAIWDPDVYAPEVEELRT